MRLFITYTVWWMMSEREEERKRRDIETTLPSSLPFPSVTG